MKLLIRGIMSKYYPFIKLKMWLAKLGYIHMWQTKEVIALIPVLLDSHHDMVESLLSALATFS